MLANPGTALVAAVVRPDPDQARSWVERELARPEYQQSLLERFRGWVGELLDGLGQAALSASALSVGAAVLALAVLTTLVLLAAGRVRREPLGTGPRDGLLPAHETTPDAHREAARQALAAGRYDEALVEAFRALASGAVRRGLLEPRPGLTAHELVDDLAPAFPARAEALSRAATAFDSVFYGGRPADQTAARAVLDLEESVRRDRPSGRSSWHDPDTLVVPR